MKCGAFEMQGLAGFANSLFSSAQATEILKGRFGKTKTQRRRYQKPAE
jgi:hypothetical protein